MRVFLNYRNGDGEDFAAMLDRELSPELGAGNVFRSSKSVDPGALFAHSLLSTVRRCDALVAVIGVNWLRILADRGGRDEIDWVRTELVEAFEHGVTVIPFYVGGRQPLKDADLPSDLARVGLVHGILFDHRAPEHAIERLRTVLGLPESAQNTAAETPDSRVGIRSIVAGKAQIVGNNAGPVHFGSGSIFQLPGGTAP
ncbi:TIR domain-containing protein [Actinokineospora fastidiosa]|uniref:TIR domain-containing protein n=1 Tax=Actinokineospora fastidiosa TaxID=1816 RepID=A0A918LI34_9PSEU|nr:TIR domain-containing protein [Actinokineospora fastidiosa]GGS54262.1 hypothetical protein GCM10010171_56730 [Actinokineospora fastidiosa]